MFRFALQPLLDRRKLTYEAARMRFAAVEHTLLQAERARDALEHRLRDAALTNGEPQAVALLLDRQQRAVAAAIQRRDWSRHEFAAASSSLSVLESLRTRALEAHRQARRRRDEAEIDEGNARWRSIGGVGN